MWQAIKVWNKLNVILKNHIVTWFITGKLSPWSLFKDLTNWLDQLLDAKGYKKSSELMRESQKIQDMMDSAGDSVPPRKKARSQKRNRFGRIQ